MEHEFKNPVTCIHSSASSQDHRFDTFPQKFPYRDLERECCIFPCIENASYAEISPAT
jgi:hypothetical protein